MAQSNLLLTNELAQLNHFDESNFMFWGIWSDSNVLFHFLMKFLKANRFAKLRELLKFTLMKLTLPVQLLNWSAYEVVGKAEHVICASV